MSTTEKDSKCGRQREVTVMKRTFFVTEYMKLYLRIIIKYILNSGILCKFLSSKHNK